MLVQDMENRNPHTLLVGMYMMKPFWKSLGVP